MTTKKNILIVDIGIKEGFRKQGLGLRLHDLGLQGFRGFGLRVQCLLLT